MGRRHQNQLLHGVEGGQLLVVNREHQLVRDIMLCPMHLKIDDSGLHEGLSLIQQSYYAIAELLGRRLRACET